MDIDEMRRLRAQREDWKRRWNAAKAEASRLTGFDPPERHDAARVKINALIAEKEQLDRDGM